jgi:cold shock CspA family protein
VHESGLLQEVKDEDKVQFEVEQGKKGINAP